MNSKILIALLLSLLALLPFINREKQQIDQFNNWKQKFGTQFKSSEEVFRRIIFENNLKIIQAHNKDPSQTYKMGVNQFTIYSDQQFKQRFLSEIVEPEESQKIEVLKFEQDQEKYVPPNADIDWTTKGKVSSVKNQGSCGSCWAFAAVASSESWALFSSKTYDLSEQQLVDCSGSYGNKGCQGGWPSSALQYIMDKGLKLESEYPYVAQQQTCKYSSGSFKINSYVTVTNNCSALTTSIAVQPIAVTVDATNWSRYSSGVFNNCSTSINHAVLLVGVVSSNWKIKNSWGASWGESGYIRLSSGNTCGLCLNKSSYPK